MDRLEKSRKNKNTTNIYRGNVRGVAKYRVGWKEKFKKYAEEGEDELLIPDFFDDWADETECLNKDAKLKNIVQNIRDGKQTFITKSLKELESYE